MIIIYNWRDMRDRQEFNWAKQNFTFKNIEKYLTFKQKPQISVKQILGSIGATVTSCILSHQLVYLTQSKYRQNQYRDLLAVIKGNYYSNKAATRHSIVTFVSKILVDATDYSADWRYNQYAKGGIAGFISFMINRPLDQIQTAKNIIFQNENKHIGTFEALRVIMRYDGLRGFYKHENLLGPLTSCLHRSIYFGLYYRLTMFNNNPLNVYICQPLIASVGASLSTILLDKCRTFYIRKHLQRQTSLQRRNKKTMIDSSSITKQLFSYILSKQFVFTKQQLAALSLIVFKNWVVLSLFMLGQDHLHFDKYLTLQSPNRFDSHRM